MSTYDLLSILHTAGKLRDTPRHCYTPGAQRESVAEHSWRITLMAMLTEDEFPQADMKKVMQMCLIHDLGECFTGDIPAFEKTASDEDAERKLLTDWVSSLPSPICEKMQALYEEMDAMKTVEARIYKAFDKLEAIISHNESDISTWEQNEYSLNLTYGVEQCSFSPFLASLRQAVKAETIEKMAHEAPDSIKSEL